MSTQPLAAIATTTSLLPITTSTTPTTTLRPPPLPTQASACPPCQPQQTCNCNCEGKAEKSCPPPCVIRLPKTPIIIKQIPPPAKGKEEAEGHGEKGGGGPQSKALIRYTKWVAIFTLALALFTFALVITSAYQGRVLQRSLHATQSMLVLTHRPKLIVRNVVLRYPRSFPSPPPRDWFWPGEYVAGQLYIANIGGTPAHIVDSGCWVYWQQGKWIEAGDFPEGAAAGKYRTTSRWENWQPMERPYEGKRGNVGAYGTIPPGASKPLPFQSEAPMGPEGQHIREGTEGWSLWVMGWIEYEDEADPPIRRRMAFCREWASNARRFFPVEDPDYEHAD